MRVLARARWGLGGTLLPCARNLARAHAAPEMKKRAAADAARRNTFQRHSALLRAARQSGDDSRMTSAVEAARRDSVPRHVIDKALSPDNDAPQLEHTVVELAARGGVLLLVSARTANRTALVQDVRRVINRHDTGSPTAALWAFQKVATFAFPVIDGVDTADLELAAIDHGADDIAVDDAGASGDGSSPSSLTTVIKVACEGEDADVRATRAASGLAKDFDCVVPLVETTYEPATRVVVDDEEDLHAASRLIDALTEVDGVDQVLTNIDYGGC
mmetsp:Transcript_7177/g.19509  ORF Transcript_7177/g.19509 Transcript_7177/m.19509 type:complete len:274 (+) Transcript_7177:55-876(+)